MTYFRGTLYACMSFLVLAALGLSATLGFSSRRIGKLLEGYATNEFEQITYSVYARRIPCPPDDSSILILVPMGQSNAGNSIVGGRSDLNDSRIINFYAGNCTIARDPLIGNGGVNGSIWAPLAEKLLDGGRWSKVVIAPMAVGGTSIAQWGKNAELYLMAETRLRDLIASGYTHLVFLWHQGEADNRGDASGYALRLNELIALTQRLVPNSKFFVAKASLCGGRTNAKVKQAQGSVVNPDRGVYLGPNTDELDGAYRADGCHFSPRGIPAEVDLWLKALDGHL